VAGYHGNCYHLGAIKLNNNTYTSHRPIYKMWKRQSNFSSDELQALTFGAVTYCRILALYDDDDMTSVTRNVCL